MNNPNLNSEQQMLLQTLTEIQNNDELASFLIDEDGLNRAEGKIKNIEHTDKDVLLTLENSQQIALSKIAAVNGNFISVYRQC